jgi:hypothetical protein
MVEHQSIDQLPNKDSGPVHLVLLGSARHQEDLDRVKELKQLAKKLNVEVCLYPVTLNILIDSSLL